MRASSIGGIRTPSTRPKARWSSCCCRRGIGRHAASTTAFYAGDTGYSRDFTDIRERLAPRQAGHGFDIALLPIGAYEPRWFMADQHVNVHEAVKIHQDLGAKRSLGVHWGTFELTDESLDEPPRQLTLERSAAGLTEADFFVLAIGETRCIPVRAVRR
jgi:N-acyl-phosphatidylethanolamine-hydrolysing phospholipase D